MKIIYTDAVIKRYELRQNLKTLYLFGDNTERRGMGGMAGEMRGEPNAIGVATKRKPTNGQDAFYGKEDLNVFTELMQIEMAKIRYTLEKGDYDTLVIPVRIGMGRARLCSSLINVLQVHLVTLVMDLLPKVKG